MGASGGTAGAGGGTAGAGGTNAGTGALGGSGGAAGAAGSAAGADGSAGASGGTTGTPVYSTLSDLSRWSEIGIRTISSDDARFAGGTFDGRYVYFAPFTNTFGEPGVFIRNDSRGDFGAASWQVITTTAVGSPQGDFSGAIFDGRYVHYVPYGQGRQGYITLPSDWVRYDTQADFTTPTAWSRYPLSATGFYGAVFDGRYIYAVPSSRSTTVRLDTQGSFDAASSWTELDLSALDPTATRFLGGVFDGRYVYFVPGGTQTRPRTSRVSSPGTTRPRHSRR